jgi:hypothetical protein
VAFLDTLSATARQAYPIIQRGVREGLSSRALDSLIREGLGSSIRRQTLLDIIRDVRNIFDVGAQLRFLNQESRPNPARLPEALTKIRREFSFTVEVRGIFGPTGLSTIQNVTITSDTLLTRREMEEAAIEAVEEGSDRYQLDIVSAIPIQGLRAGSSGRF